MIEQTGTDIACKFTVRKLNLQNGGITQMADIPKYNWESIPVGEIWVSPNKHHGQDQSFVLSLEFWVGPKYLNLISLKYQPG